MSELCGERWLETGSPFMSDLERIDALKKTLTANIGNVPSVNAKS